MEGPAEASASRTLKEAPPPGRSSTHARPPWSSAKRATSDRPTPTPGDELAGPGPCRKGSKIASLSSSGTPSPSSSTTSRSPSSRRSTRAQMRRSGDVCREAFDNRFSTIRSTFGGATFAMSFPAPPSPPRPVGDGRAHVAPPALRGDGPALQSIEVEQVAEQAFELSGIRRDPPEQVDRVLAGDVHARLLEGDPRAQDAR